MRADILNSKKVFKIGKIKWNAKYNPIAYDVWGFKFYDDDEEDIRKINILLDTNPMEGGTYGQIVLLQYDNFFLLFCLYILYFLTMFVFLIFFTLQQN